MKTHCMIGYHLLHDEENEFLIAAAQIARDHHEKWNGEGYPHARKGEEISLFGRITAIADVFDALSSKRPYKEAWSFEEAFDYIKANVGSHFDPKLAEIFIGQEDRVRGIYETNRD